jgi:hypothetical protein
MTQSRQPEGRLCAAACSRCSRRGQQFERAGDLEIWSARSRLRTIARRSFLVSYRGRHGGARRRRRVHLLPMPRPLRVAAALPAERAARPLGDDGHEVCARHGLGGDLGRDVHATVADEHARAGDERDLVGTRTAEGARSGETRRPDRALARADVDDLVDALIALAERLRDLAQRPARCVQLDGVALCQPR